MDDFYQTKIEDTDVGESEIEDTDVSEPEIAGTDVGESDRETLTEETIDALYHMHDLSQPELQFLLGLLLLV